MTSIAWETYCGFKLNSPYSSLHIFISVSTSVDYLCVTEGVPHKNMERNHSHRELFVCAHCPWTSMSTKALLKLCSACFPFVYSTSFQVHLSAADQSDRPRFQGEERNSWKTHRQTDRQMLYKMNLLLATFLDRVCGWILIR